MSEHEFTLPKTLDDVVTAEDVVRLYASVIKKKRETSDYDDTYGDIPDTLPTSVILEDLSKYITENKQLKKKVRSVEHKEAEILLSAIWTAIDDLYQLSGKIDNIAENLKEAVRGDYDEGL